MAHQDARTLDTNVLEAARRNERMRQDYAKGQKICAGVLVKALKKPALRLLKKWKALTEDSMLETLQRTLQHKMAMHQKLQSINCTLGQRNRSLRGENEELRQASIDGLEIADVKRPLT